MNIYFLEGKTAKQNGLSLIDNPYIDTTFESIEWDKGFKGKSFSKYFY